LFCFRNVSDWAGYKSSYAFRGHNTWAFRRFLWRCWHHAEREREDTQVRIRIHISSQRGTCNKARPTENNKPTGSYCFVSSHKQQSKCYSPSIMLFL